jgi:hypothetical protein
MSAPSASAKVCIHCGQDCSAKPRTKDAHGRYACKPCHEHAMAAAAGRAQPAKVPAKVAAAAPATQVDDGGYDDGAFLASLADGVGGAVGSQCPSCGAGMVQGAVICTTCGYNTETGGQIKVSKRDPNAPKKEKISGGGVARAAAGSAAILFSIIGGVVGGGIGAVIWAAIAYATHYEVGYVAVGVGALSGGGVYVIAQKHAGALTGLIAAGIAVLAILGGKYAAFNAILDDADREITRDVAKMITDEDIQQKIADEVVTEFTTKKKKMVWPEGMTPELAEMPEDYPPNVWAEATKRWEAMSYEDKKARRHAMEDEVKAAVATMVESVRDEGFGFDLFDIVWGVLAIGAAFSIGSGAKANAG